MTSPSQLLVLSDEHVTSILNHHISLFDILTNQRDVFVSLSSEKKRKEASETSASLPDIDAPLRTPLRLPNHTSLFMPARLFQETTCKIVSVPRADSAQCVPKGLPAATVVLDAFQGNVKAIVNAARLTAVRTAAGSMLSLIAMHNLTKFRNRAPYRIAVFGGGIQGVAHAAQIADLFKSYGGEMSMSFVTRSGDFNQGIAKDMGAQLETLANVRVSHIRSHDRDTVEKSVREAEVIITCTPSTEPLFTSDWVTRGAHIILVGSYKPTMCEVDCNLIDRAKGQLLVDDVEACAHEAGELIQAGIRAEDCIPLGDIYAASTLDRLRLQDLWIADHSRVSDAVQSMGTYSASDREDRISIFKSVGIGIQDVAITSLVVQYALANKVGENVVF